MPKVTECSACVALGFPGRKVAAKGLCNSCYYHERRATDPEYRERRNAQVRERRADPEYRERQNAQVRERRANDPEYRERRNAQQRERRAQLKLQKVSVT